VVDNQDECSGGCGPVWTEEHDEQPDLAVSGPGGWARGRSWPSGGSSWTSRRCLSGADQADPGARSDAATVALAEKRAADYLACQAPAETDRQFVDNAFLLEQVFRGLMSKAECRAITINSCMGTIMPISETTACLPLSILNDDGYMAFCESDFVVIPSGILAGNISGHPTFLNDPCYPHDGEITLAHCTAPALMDGKNREPVRILTHFESDYGASPKVEMRRVRSRPTSCRGSRPSGG
jgi:hypothetical protein